MKVTKAHLYILLHAAELDAAILPGRHIVLEEAAEGVDEDGQRLWWVVGLYEGDTLLWEELSNDPVDTLLNPCNGVR